MIQRKTISELTNLSQQDGLYGVSDLGIEIMIVHINLLENATQIAVINNTIYYRIKSNEAFSGFINSELPLKKSKEYILDLEVSLLPSVVQDIFLTNSITKILVTNDYELEIKKSVNTEIAQMSLQSLGQSVNNDSEFIKFVNNFPQNPVNKTMYLKESGNSFETKKNDNFVLVEFRKNDGELIIIKKGYPGSLMNIPALNEDISEDYFDITLSLIKWSEIKDGYMPISAIMPNINKTYYQTLEKSIIAPKHYYITRNSQGQMTMTGTHFIKAHTSITIYPFYVEGYQVFAQLIYQNYYYVDDQIWHKYQINLNILGLPNGQPGTTTTITGNMNIHEDGSQPHLVGSIPVKISIIHPSGGITD